MAYKDLREWLDKLKAEGELKTITSEVNWDRELGTIVRMVLNRGGPALLFENIKDYRDGPCTKLFTGGLSRLPLLAMSLGLPRETESSELVRFIMEKNKERVAPVIVESGPVKENIIPADRVNLYDFPVPKWHHLDGGRYINTFAGIITRDPETGTINVGLYRGMIGQKDTIPSLLIMSQHWGHHLSKYAAMGKRMPVAVVCGTEPIFPFIACSPLPVGVDEYEVMGAFMGRPAELVRCETSDLVVPATAEIVMEGYVSADPETFEMEGPFAEYTGYLGGEPGRRHVIKVECITHRHDPIFRGTITGSLPGSYCENSTISSIQRSAIAWNILESSGIPGVLDVYIHPVTTGTTACVKIRKSYQGQAQHIAAALWGSGAAQFRYKNVFVVDDDIDITDYEGLDWAFAYRVDPNKDLVVFPGSFGSPLDPSVHPSERDVGKLGTGLWNRLLIDATKDWTYPRRPEWGNDVYPPTVRPAPEDEKKVAGRWEELGLGDL